VDVMVAAAVVVVDIEFDSIISALFSFVII
jgi:hypothetical protein